ncbi:hypothetical protein [Sediminicola luteus]|nr:hypothetical protein [Sediminicola luteus]
MSVPKLIILSFLFNIGTLHAQQSKALVSDFERLFTAFPVPTLPQIHSNKHVEAGLRLLFHPVDTIPYFRDSLMQAQQQDLLRNKGLSVRANGRWNGSGIVWEEDDPLSANRILLKTGLHWDLLKSGWKQHQLASKVVALERQQLRNHAQSLGKRKEYGLRYSGILTHFQYQGIGILEERLAFITQAEPLLAKLYEQRFITYHELVEWKQRKETVSNQLYTSRTLVKGNDIPELSPNKPPVFDIDFNGIINHFRQESAPDSLQYLAAQKQALLFKQANMPSLQFYGQVQASQDLLGTERVAPIIGFQFAIPLSKKMSRKTATMQQAYDTQNNEAQRQNQEKELAVYYLQYMEKRKQWESLQYQMELLRHKLLMQRLYHRMEKKDTQISTLKLRDDWFALQYESHALLGQMYLELLGMAFTANFTSAKSFDKSFSPAAHLQHISPIVVGVAPDIGEKELNVLLSFLLSQRIHHIHLTGLAKHSVEQRLRSEGFILWKTTSELEQLTPEELIPKNIMVSSGLPKYYITDANALFNHIKNSFDEKVQF